MIGYLLVIAVFPYIASSQTVFVTAQRNLLNTFGNYRSHCIEKTHPNISFVNRWLIEKQTPDKSLGSFIKCLLTKSNILDTNLSINEKHFMDATKVVPNDIMRNIIDTCEKEISKSPCELSYKKFICICSSLKTSLNYFNRKPVVE
ncbi:hypothetical protein FQR65_LT03002 [Abscondita terminalis]|nr:hypothetical protein FQR65_LT03002 [Abscondita terminalis]